ncbi:MAG: DNA-deoxyinosine glycosylase [Firmicutes bacterium]|nr:DNA-deoxyinosine glycosylase [Bacillota bacterium]
MQHIVHPIPAFYDKTSGILILGSFPSVKSRESGFFYGHPQNRFWKVMAALFSEEVPRTVPEKADLLRRHHIAAWDSIYECDIEGSSDSSICNVVPSDFAAIFAAADIRAVFTNGRKSHEVYTKYCLPRTGRPAICLPSTSPANAAWSLERLIEAWRVILEYL